VRSPDPAPTSLTRNPQTIKLPPASRSSCFAGCRSPMRVTGDPARRRRRVSSDAPDARGCGSDGPALSPRQLHTMSVRVHASSVTFKVPNVSVSRPARRACTASSRIRVRAFPRAQFFLSSKAGSDFVGAVGPCRRQDLCPTFLDLQTRRARRCRIARTRAVHRPRPGRGLPAIEGQARRSDKNGLAASSGWIIRRTARSTRHGAAGNSVGLDFFNPKDKTALVQTNRQPGRRHGATNTPPGENSPGNEEPARLRAFPL